MKKIYKFVFIALSIIYTCSCAYTVIEVRSVPSLDKWGGIIDPETYHPNDVSNIIDMGEFQLFISLSNYSTIYRGLKIFGAEAEREPDFKSNNDSELVLILGIRPKNKQFSKLFLGSKVKLVIGQSNKVNVLPKDVYLGSPSAACAFDFDGIRWGGKSRKLEGVTLLSFGGLENSFECFNIIFDISDIKFNKYLALDFSETLLPLKNKTVYFHPKKIKWIRGN